MDQPPSGPVPSPPGLGLGPSLGLSPAQWCQVFFCLSGVTVLAVAAAPLKMGNTLMAYGPRRKAAGEDSKESSKVDKGAAAHSPQQQQQYQQPGRAMALFAAVMRGTQVPHAWFGSFYAVSLLMSAFWAVEYAFLCRPSPAGDSDGGGSGGEGSNNCVLRRLAVVQLAADGGVSSGMTMGQVKFLWACMVLQAARRGLEQATLVRRSTSKMWVVHWLLGIAFYVFMSIAVWIDGSGAILASLRSTDDTGSTMVRGTELPFNARAMVPVILYAWYYQNWCHRYLASLKKYSVPIQGKFQILVCPHYTFECLIYLAMAVAGMPSRGPKSWNRTMFWAVFFIVGNLGATARGTRRWYADKFGEKSISGKWTMFPYIF